MKLVNRAYQGQWFEFETTGRKFSAYGGNFIGIDADLDVGTSHEEGFTYDLGGFVDETQFIDDEKRELAVHMMRRWAKYGKIPITGDTADTTRSEIFDLDLTQELG